MENKNQSVVAGRISFNEKAKITDKLTLKPKVKEYFIHDIELSGFWIRVPTEGKEASYLVHAKPQGSRKAMRRYIGNVSLYKAKEAREIAREWLHSIKQGVCPKEAVKKAHRESMRLSEAFEQYIKDKSEAGKLSPKSIINYREAMRNRLAPLMRTQIRTLSKEDVVNWYKNTASVSRSLAERNYRELNAVLNYQVALGNLDSNPAKAVSTLGLRAALKPRATYLTAQEVGAVVGEVITQRLEGLPKHVRTAHNLWLFTVLTGLREKTIYNLMWSQIKLRDSVFIETTKNGDSYLLPLTPLLNDILEDQRVLFGTQVQHVFPNRKLSGPIVDPRKSLDSLYRSAGLTKEFSDHDLRRTFSSLADLVGVAHTDIKHLLIHRKKDITERYIQSYQIKAKDNYQRIADLVAGSTLIAVSHEMNHYMTTDLLRYALFGKGPLCEHPGRDDADFMLQVSSETLREQEVTHWH